MIHNNIIGMRLNCVKDLKIKMSDRNSTQRFDVVMTSLSSDKKPSLNTQLDSIHAKLFV